MNQEQIIQMALDSGMAPFKHSVTVAHVADLERFAAMVAAAAVRETSAEYRLGWNDGQINEREACAHLCDLEAREATEGEWTGCAIYLANNIRKRGRT